jgi:hypothetical protein
MNFSIERHDTQYMQGLGTVYRATSALNPEGTMYVICEKHPTKHIVVPFSMHDDGFAVGDKILQAFKRCPDCMEVEEWKTTRWPNVGEPGGAEL